MKSNFQTETPSYPDFFSWLEKEIASGQLATSSFHNQYIYSYKIVSHGNRKGEKNSGTCHEE